MKLQFGKQDSIYTIFKTIKKIPAYKAVTIYIDPEHEIFGHQRRGQQLQETIDQYHLDATFVVTTPHSQSFYHQYGLKTVFRHKHIFSKISQQTKDLLFKTQQFHTSLIFKNSYLSYLIMLSELCVIGLILYFFRGLISPNATITIQPAHHIESIVYNYAYIPYDTANASLDTDVLHIPYYHGALPYEHRMTLNVENITYDIKQAQGTVKIINTRNEEYSLLPETKLVTIDGLLFQTDKAVYVPFGTPDDPGVAYVEVTALDYTEGGAIIGEDGNLPKETTLYIKNLSESLDDKEIYALTTNNFAGGSTIAQGSVIAEDITTIEASIITHMQNTKKEQLQASQLIDNDIYILLYDDYITLEIEEFISTSHIGESTSFIEGEVKAHIAYIYIKKSDIKQAIASYIQQRASSNVELLNYDFTSFTMYDIHKTNDQGRMYIPTKLNIIWGYNFRTDVNNMVAEMKAKIANKSAEQANDILLEYDEIQDATVAISPPRYDTLPDVKSRIKFRVTK